MPDHARCTEVIRAGTPLRVGPVAMLPIERIRVHAGLAAGAAWFTAAKEPYALVVVDEGGARALAIGADRVSLESLRQAIPGLDGFTAS